MTTAAWQHTLVDRFTKWWALERMPWIDWIQVEVTSRCNAACTYCPRTVYRSTWENRDLSLDTFERLLPILAKTKMVHLQGWGEPLLHKQFFEIVASVKKAGCKVGTTTNGMMLDRPAISRLVESGIDHVAFSLTGIGEKNNRVREGTEFSRILQTISDLVAEKKAHQTKVPMVNVVYLLFRSHLPDIGKIVPVLAGIGIQQVIISTLDFIPDKDLQKEYLVPRNESEYQELKSLLDQLAGDGERAGLRIHYRLVTPGEKNQICTENAERALFVSADGAVSPCVFANIPASGASHVAGGYESAYRRFTFGNVADESIPAMWWSKPYTAFRDSFDSTPNPLCRECQKLSPIRRLS
jgi:MoaA/NifB/PqqE/SkfB family radical SAM enzyme